MSKSETSLARPAGRCLDSGGLPRRSGEVPKAVFLLSYTLLLWSVYQGVLVVIQLCGGYDFN